jgi:hypothetical protein
VIYAAGGPSPPPSTRSRRPSARDHRALRASRSVSKNAKLTKRGGKNGAGGSVAGRSHWSFATCDLHIHSVIMPITSPASCARSSCTRRDFSSWRSFRCAPSARAVAEVQASLVAVCCWPLASRAAGDLAASGLPSHRRVLVRCRGVAALAVHQACTHRPVAASRAMRWPGSVARSQTAHGPGVRGRGGMVVVMVSRFS